MTSIDGIRRIVFREISPADVKSAQAKSNTAKTGGGARDLRFAHAEVGPVLAAMLPHTRIEKRKRDGERTDETIHSGLLHYWSDPAPDGTPGSKQSVKIDYEPPTDSRPNMGRIARTHKIPPINRRPDTGKGRVFAMFLENNDSEVWFHYVYEQDLRTPGLWHTEVVKTILGCLDDPHRRQSKMAEGYHDMTKNKRYCHL